ncbi:hypothetical protein VM98_37995, partial [Streptomyces rubellomurinus subsp. indigoferus]
MLRALGLAEDRIANSRDLDYEQRFAAARAGRGLDLVLNSLAQEHLDAPLRPLPPRGRVPEIRQTDVAHRRPVRAAHPVPHERELDLMHAGPHRNQRTRTELGAL